MKPVSLKPLVERQREVVRELALAASEAKADGAVGFCLVWIKPCGDYGDSFDCDDILQMTAAVNDSALKARIEANRR